MAVNHELEREWTEVQRMKFWRNYERAIQDARNRLDRQLERDGSVGQPCVRGEIWQSLISMIDRILDLPNRVVGYEPTDEEAENPKGTA